MQQEIDVDVPLVKSRMRICPSITRDLDTAVLALRIFNDFPNMVDFFLQNINK